MALVLQNRGVVASTSNKSNRKKDIKKYLMVQTTGSQAVDSGHNTTFGKSDNSKRRGESKFKKEDSKEKKIK